MAYPRRRRSSASLTASPQDLHDEQLVPPRPSFLAAHTNRSSNSSLDSLEAASTSASDSEREAPPPRRVKARPPPPPSSFAFPFQAYAGNPDPGLPIPGGRRRSSLDSATPSQGVTQPPPVPAKSSSVDGHGVKPSTSYGDLKKPTPAFMADADGESIPRSSSSNSLFRQSAAANLSPDPSSPNPNPSSGGAIPRNSSIHSFRAPFLAPSSRPSSSIWTPPQLPVQYATVNYASPSASTTALPITPSSANMLLKVKPPPLPSTRLPEKLGKEDKPWLHEKSQQRGTRSSYCITLICILIGVLGAAAIVLFGWNEVHLIDESRLCSVMDEKFDGDGLNEDVWNYEVQLGGFGNGEFQMTTRDPDNVFLSNGQLYIQPTLTSLKVDGVMDGGSFDFGDQCTVQNKSACSVSSDSSKGTVINPVQSARINTKGKKGIRFGKVEVRAKLPRGDWLWPAIWMLPEREDLYGQWPASGEIDILESRGNDPSTYSYQANDFVRAGVNYGPMPGVFKMLFGWWQRKRGSKGDGGWGNAWHTWTLEWDERVLRVWVDKRSQRMLEIDLGPKSLFGKGKKPKKGMWDVGGFPKTARNGSTEVVLENPYQPGTKTLDDGSQLAVGSAMAPFDQKFYLILDVAVGGTSGWFPDGVGGKMWFDGSGSAMRDFARAQDNTADGKPGWGKSWGGRDDRSLRVDYIKMWEKC